MTRFQHQITTAICAILAVALLATIVVANSAEDEPIIGAATDESLFPKAYGILANEMLMFPVDMSDWPVKIDSSRMVKILSRTPSPIFLVSCVSPNSRISAA